MGRLAQTLGPQATITHPSWQRWRVMNGAVTCVYCAIFTRSAHAMFFNSIRISLSVMDSFSPAEPRARAVLNQIAAVVAVHSHSTNRPAPPGSNTNATCCARGLPFSHCLAALQSQYPAARLCLCVSIPSSPGKVTAGLTMRST